MSNTYGPYSSYSKCGRIIYTAGQVGAKNGKSSTDIKVQTKTALANLQNVLLEAGSDLSRVVKVSIFLVNMDDFQQMNDIYADIFRAAGSKPARTTVGVNQLPAVADNKLLIEIEAIAELS